MLRNLLLTALLLTAPAAFAADMPLKAPSPAVVGQINSWTGFYVGIQGGENLGSFSLVAGDTKINLDDNSLLVGGQMGYLHQFGGLVIGPEIGFQYLGLKGENQVIEETTLQQKLDWIFYAGARAGLPIGNLMPFIGGGAAWAHAKGAVTDVPQLSLSSAPLGYYIEGGLAFRITQQWSVEGVYRHNDFGNVTSIVGLPPSAMRVDQIMGRLNVKLN